MSKEKFTELFDKYFKASYEDTIKGVWNAAIDMAAEEGFNYNEEELNKSSILNLKFKP